MPKKINKDVCIGCGACIGNCPLSIIEFGDGIAIINEDACIDCGVCTSVCPVDAVEEV